MEEPSVYTTQAVTAKVDKNGRLALPARQRRLAGIEAGDTVLVSVREGALQISAMDTAIRRAQELARRYYKGKRRPSESLIRERRKEAARE